MRATDFSPLTAPARPDEETFVWARPGRSMRTLVTVLVVVLGILFLPAGVIAALVLWFLGLPVTALAYAALAALVALGMLLFRVHEKRTAQPPTVRLSPRLPAFAAANGLILDREVPAPRVPVMAFSSRRMVAHRVVDRLHSDDGAPDPAPGTAEMGDYFWSVDYGMGSVATRACAYVAIRMPRALPTIAVQSVSTTGAELEVHGAQALALEGDWDRYFTLLCPPGYEQDALQLVTPDVMAAMLEGAMDWSAVVRDRWLVFISASQFSWSRPSAYTSAFRLVEVARQFTEQAEHYSDARVGDRARDIVAAGGTRLRGAGDGVLMGVALALPLVALVLASVVPLITGGR